MNSFYKISPFLLLAAIVILACNKEDPPQFLDIPDDAFLNALIECGVDTNGDGEICPCEAEAITSLDVSNRNISDMTGIDAFINLDLSNNIALDTLSCGWCQLTVLDVTNSPELTCLHLAMNHISELDLSNNLKLEELDCSSNHSLPTVDLSNNVKLKKLNCSYNSFTSLDVTKNTALEWFHCDINALTSLNLSNNSKLVRFGCSQNRLTSLHVPDNAPMDYLRCDYNLLTSLDLTNLSALRSLHCENNSITSLDVTGNEALEKLHCGENQLTSLNLSNNPLLNVLDCSSNSFSTLDLSNNPELGSGSWYFIDHIIEDIVLSDMPTLGEVCVWKLPFPPEDVTVDTTGSPNVFFATSCSI